MPISRENRRLYPPPVEWAAIRREVLSRDDDRCKFCGVANHCYGLRWPGGTFSIARGCRTPGAARAWAEAGFPGCRVDDYGWLWVPGRGRDCRRNGKIIRIILTITHLDHDPGNNGSPRARPNLAALCQRCHNRHDATHRRVTAAATRAKNKSQKALDGAKA